MTYDKRGRRTGMTDPDRGAMTYAYNGFDELVRQTDARGQLPGHDLRRAGAHEDAQGLCAGRAGLRRTVGGPADRGMPSWTWDDGHQRPGPGCKTVTDTVSGHTRTLTYDTHGRADVTAVTPGSGAGTYYEQTDL